MENSNIERSRIGIQFGEDFTDPVNFFNCSIDFSGDSFQKQLDSLNFLSKDLDLEKSVVLKISVSYPENIESFCKVLKDFFSSGIETGETLFSKIAVEITKKHLEFKITHNDKFIFISIKGNIYYFI